MPKAMITAFATLAALTFAAQTASGQEREAMPPTITVSSNGSVDYVPDIARVQLGIRAQAASASAAAATVNQTVAQVVAAIQRQGIGAGRSKPPVTVSNIASRSRRRSSKALW